MVALVNGYRLAVSGPNWVLQRYLPERVSETGKTKGQVVAEKWVDCGYYSRPADALGAAVNLVLRDGVESGAVSTLSEMREAFGRLEEELRVKLGGAR